MLYYFMYYDVSLKKNIYIYIYILTSDSKCNSYFVIKKRIEDFNEFVYYWVSIHNFLCCMYSSIYINININNNKNK